MRICRRNYFLFFNGFKILETTCIIAARDIGRRFVVSTAVVVVDNLANRIVVDPDHGIGIIFSWFQGA